MTYEQRLLAGYSHIIECHAETCVKRIARKTFHHLQKCKRESGMMQSEPDSGLENIWDEVCVQVQREHSALWDLYEEYILTSITGFLETDCTTAEKQMIWECISRLGEREQEIMKMRFGLEGKEELTQKEVADILGISQSYISRIEKKIVSKIKIELSKVI